MFRRANHLTNEELLHLIDGEASAGLSHTIQRHLSTCADCRLRKQNLEHASAEFSDLYRTVTTSQTPSASEARATLKAHLTVSPQPASSSLLERFSIANHRWAYVTAVVAIVAASAAVFKLQDRSFFNVPSLSLQLEARLLPDSRLTPGATRPVGLADICSQDDSDLDPSVSSSTKQIVFQEYGMKDTATNDFQVDYLINPQLGGTDDVRNLWPEPYGSRVWNARAKDALESRLHHMVCTQQIDLASAQREIATDWIAAYKKYFHTATHA